MRGRSFHPVRIGGSRPRTEWRSSEASPAAHKGLELAQSYVNAQPNHTNGNHPGHDGPGGNVALTLHHHVTDTSGSHDKPGTYQRLPTTPGANAKPRHDGGEGSWQQHLQNRAQIAGPQHLRSLDIRAVDKARTAIGVNETRRKRTRKYDQNRTSEPRTEPQCGEWYPRDG